MYNLIVIRKSIRNFLLISNINKINLCIIGIKIHIYPYVIFHLSNFNILKSVLYTEQLAISQLIILNKSVII